MGTAVLDGQASTARSASQTLHSRQAHNVLSPVFRRSIAGSAPSTPSAAVQMEGFKRPKKAATEDDHGESTLVIHIGPVCKVKQSTSCGRLLFHNAASPLMHEISASTPQTAWTVVQTRRNSASMISGVLRKSTSSS